MANTIMPRVSLHDAFGIACTLASKRHAVYTVSVLGQGEAGFRVIANAEVFAHAEPVKGGKDFRLTIKGD